MFAAEVALSAMEMLILAGIAALGIAVTVGTVLLVVFLCRTKKPPEE